VPTDGGKNRCDAWSIRKLLFYANRLEGRAATHRGDALQTLTNVLQGRRGHAAGVQGST
jgi:hypothetical protein